MDLFYIKRHKFPLLRLGSVLLLLFCAVAGYGAYSAWEHTKLTKEERNLRAQIAELQEKTTQQKKSYEDLELALRHVKAFSDRNQRYLTIAKGLTKTVGPNARTLLEKLLQDNVVTLINYTPVFNQKLTWGRQVFVGTKIQLKCVGSFSGFGRFLASLENTVPFMYVQRMELLPLESNDKQDDIKVDMDFLIIDGLDRS